LLGPVTKKPAFGCSGRAAAGFWSGSWLDRRLHRRSARGDNKEYEAKERRGDATQAAPALTDHDMLEQLAHENSPSRPRDSGARWGLKPQKRRECKGFASIPFRPSLLRSSVFIPA